MWDGREDSKSTKKSRSRHGDLSSVDHEIQREANFTHTKEKRNGSDRNIILGSSPSTLEIGLYLSPEYRYVNSEIRPHYLFLVPFFPFILFRSYAASSPRGRSEARARERFRFTKTLKSHKKDHNGMEACNIYRFKDIFTR